MKTQFKNKLIHESRGWDWETEEARQMHSDVTAILERHFSKFGLSEFERMASRFLSHYEVALAEMWCRRDERKKLSELKHQLRKIVETYSSIHWLIQHEIGLNSTLPLRFVNGSYVQSEEHENCSVESAQHPPHLAFQALGELSENYRGLLLALEKTSRGLPEGIQYKKRAHEAWRVVEAAAELCGAYSDTINVPKALNPTSPFHKLLEDLLCHFEINTSPEGAFRGWKKNVDNIREDLDLLPIY